MKTAEDEDEARPDSLRCALNLQCPLYDIPLPADRLQCQRLLEFKMFQAERRLAELTKSRAKLLAELQELDRLREQVRNVGRPGACIREFQQSPPRDRQICGDPGPVGF